MDKNSCKNIIIIILLISALFLGYQLIIKQENFNNSQCSCTTQSNQAIQNISSLYGNKTEPLILNNVKIIGNLEVNGDGNFNGNLHSGGVINATGQLQSSSASINGNIYASGNITANSDLIANGGISTSGNISAPTGMVYSKLSSPDGAKYFEVANDGTTNLDVNLTINGTTYGTVPSVSPAYVFTGLSNPGWYPGYQTL